MFESRKSKPDISHLLDIVFDDTFGGTTKEVKDEYIPVGRYTQLEKKGTHILTINVAGNPKDSVTIDVIDDELTIKTHSPETDKKSVIEKVNLKFSLNGSFDLESITAEQKDGILTIYLHEEIEEKSLPLQVAIN